MPPARRTGESRSLALLPPDWEPTRLALHRFSRVISAVPRAYAVADPRWWHLSLEVRPEGLTTRPVPLPGGGDLRVVLDVIQAEVRVESSPGGTVAISLSSGPTASTVAREVFAVVAELGLCGPHDASRYADENPTSLDPGHATTFWGLLREVDAVLRRRRKMLPGDPGPVQLWPHGFDIAFEWFGSRRVAGEDGEHRAQLNLGWSPTGDAYFYSNPWPLDDRLIGSPLPAGAMWHADGWTGTMLPQREVAGNADAVERVLDYAAAVFDLARPTLD